MTLDGVRIAIGIARVRGELSQVDLEHVPPPPGPKPDRRDDHDPAAERDQMLLRYLTRDAMARMSDDHKDALLRTFLCDDAFAAAPVEPDDDDIFGGLTLIHPSKASLAQRPTTNRDTYAGARRA